ncbi:hypothetical protein [Polyangium sp. y55x31]|uniref:hypothetical protein n=1 Tax=Polyangium sp. y55x31 TaxID=3042688 RepID=UPI002482FA3F|nr:hypothetical protein [Polyangium sp. y55x31]MDI1480747.1 hypothetical protein [Polyangium sp. y55x31]
MKSILLVLVASHSLLGCVAGGEPIAERDLGEVHEAPASLQRQGVARYASDAVGDIAEITLLSDRDEVLGTLSAVKDEANESLEITLALPGHDLTIAKWKGEATIMRKGRPASSSEAMTELEMARDLLVEEGFLPPSDGQARVANTAAQALQSPSSGTESASCGPMSGGCYRSSNQAWACFKAKPTCLLGYCSESACSCVDDTKWYDLFRVYICCASASCN